jgi:hypothetical protein
MLISCATIFIDGDYVHSGVTDAKKRFNGAGHASSRDECGRGGHTPIRALEKAKRR